MATNSIDTHYYQLQQNVSRALADTEMPLNVKHARAVITETFHYQGLSNFWEIALRQPILKKQISAWKFCHLLHIILREGHNSCSQDSQRNTKFITELGKLWHLTNGYGICILQYTNLLVTKIEFNTRNPWFSEISKMSRNDIKQFGDDDINFIFELTTEIFDYLDALIRLQTNVFKSMETYNINSMTLEGKCWLAALVQCIADANPLYDLSVYFMFKLHACLPFDMLDGHQQRFNAIFSQLRSFYQESNDIPYLANLVTVPKLPCQLPNFSNINDLNEYQPPIVVLFEEHVTETVMDEAIAINHMLIKGTTEPKTQVIHENDELLRLKNKIQSNDYILQTIQQEKQILVQKIQNLYTEKSQVEEKFTQLRTLYAQTREDNINMLRKNKETDEAMWEMKILFAQLKNNNVSLENQLTELKEKYEATQEIQKGNNSADKNDIKHSVQIEHLRNFEEIKKDLIIKQQQFASTNPLAETTQKYSPVTGDSSTNYNPIIPLNDDLIKLKNQILSNDHPLQIIHQEKQILEQKIQNLVTEKTKVEDKFTKLTELYTQTRDDYINLLRQNQETKKAKHEIRKSFGRLENEKANLENELIILKGDYHATQQTLQKMDAEKKEFNEELEQIQNWNSDLINKLEGLESTNHQLAESNQKLLSTITNDVKQKMNKLTSENNNLEVQLNIAIKKINTNSAEIENLTETNQTLGEEKKQLEIEIGALKVATVEMNLHCKELQTQRDELKYCNASVENSIQTEKPTQFELQKMTSDYVELEKAYNEVLFEKNQMATEIETLNSITNKLQINWVDLNQKLEDLHISNASELSLRSSLVEGKSKLELQFGELYDQLEWKCNQYTKLEQELITLKECKTTQISDIKSQLEENMKKYDQLSNDHERVLAEKNDFKNDIQDLLHRQKEQLNTITTLNAAIIESKIHGENTLDVLLQICIKSSDNLTERIISDTTISIDTITYFMVITEELKHTLVKFKFVYEKYLSDNTNVEGLVRRLISSGHLFSVMHLLGIIYYNYSNNIEKGEHEIELMKKFGRNVSTLYQLVLKKSNRGAVGMKIDELQNELQQIVSRVNVTANRACESEQLIDLIETTLNTMDKSIEEAAKLIEGMMAASKQSNSGVKLEMNEKILYSCTNLIKAIGMLVKKSNAVHAETVALGKFSSTAIEFYKLNHHWTEGMISAAKNVAQGTKFLVDAANKAVSGQARHQLDLVVAAQDIAASTAQLVVSCRVKAERGSNNLNALNDASENVTLAIGGVIAVAKDCNTKLEEQDDFIIVSSPVSIHQAKTIDMEMQVKILELEQRLQMERRKLLALRKTNCADK